MTAPIVRLLFRVRVEGIDRLPAHGPAILAFNHLSVLDGPCLAIETARRRHRESRFLVAAEIFGTFFLGWVLRLFDQIPIRRGEGDAHALDEAIDTVREGALAAIAPEGRVNDDGVTELQRIRSGVARIAIPTGAPVVPVGICGTQVRWPRSGLRLARPWRPRLALVFGEPVTPDGASTDPGDVEALTDRVRDGLQLALARARAIAGDG
jgi:1-acyl-sn-glycerol-3-phosphate acyltransferase